METKLEKANENIIYLIDLLVSARMNEIGSHCPYAYYKDKRENKTCDNCDICKEEFAERMHKDLQDEYIIV